MLKLFVFVVLFSLVSCACGRKATSSEEVTIVMGDVALKYDCQKFQPQVKTQDQNLALMGKSADVLYEAVDKEDVAFYRSLKIAR